MDAENVRASFDTDALVAGLVRNRFDPVRAALVVRALAAIEATTERLFTERLPDLLELAGNHRLFHRCLWDIREDLKKLHDEVVASELDCFCPEDDG